MLNWCNPLIATMTNPRTQHAGGHDYFRRKSGASRLHDQSASNRARAKASKQQPVADGSLIHSSAQTVGSRAKSALEKNMTTARPEPER